jgi:tetratricopeptide (TPR) repeat protein
MRISIFRLNSFLILCVLFSGTCAFSTVLAQSFSRPAPAREHFKGRGLRIIRVFADSPAERVGLKPMDLIFRYGDFDVLDDASYFAARETYEKSRAPEVQLLVWRDGKAVEFMVPSGWLGVQSNEYSPVAYQFSSVMQHIDVERQVPEYQRDYEFKNSLTPTEKLLGDAKAIIDQAEREGSLTPNQILMARIDMILDDASPEDLTRQSEMLGQLLSTQPASYLHMIGNDHFFENKHYRPAIACFKRHLEVHPDDTTIRLNMGVAYYRLRMFAEAEAAADYVLEHQLKLGRDDSVLAHHVKAIGALGRGDYQQSIVFAERAFDTALCECDISMVMLAAAETGDVQKVEDASGKFQEELSEEFARKQLQLTAVRALALVRDNQGERARELVRSWKETDRVEGRLKAYWQIYPGGADVWINWTKLTRE